MATAMGLAGVSTMQAADLKYMIITMNGGGNSHISLQLSGKPTLLVQGDLLSVENDAVSMGSINKNAVKHITYSASPELQGIADAKTTELSVSPRVTTASVTVTGLDQDADITLYNAAGTACNAVIDRQADIATVDMSALPKGMYILTINKESFKIVKK